MKLNELNDDQLAEQWLACKRAEEKANAERVAVEQELIARHPAREEGSTTTELPCGYKLETTGKLTYKADVGKLKQIIAGIPADRLPGVPIKVEEKLDETGAKWIRANDPELWAMLAPAIEIKPAKTAVKIKL